MITKPYKHFRVVVDDRGVLTVALDVTGRPLNVLTHEVMQELEDIIDDIENDRSYKLVRFQSDKESGFLAGADVGVINQIDTAGHALELIQRGQTLFQRIEWLPIPTVAVIHGPCLGGGLELSLACRYRIARDNSSTQLGLPEIKLGLIPGWGGTQRLPRVIGLTAALKMIMTGRHVSARAASKMGLVDRAFQPEHWESSIKHFIDEVLRGRVLQVSGRRRGWRGLLESTAIGRALILRSVRRKTASKTEHYPALSAALRAVQAGFDGTPQGYVRERDEFVDLLATPTCRNLLSLFLHREKARNPATWSMPSDIESRSPIRHIGIVGAGAMGAGIGQVAALRGFQVSFQEINEQTVASGRCRIERLINDYANHKGWNQESRDQVQDKISITCDHTALSACDLVIEAVVEREEIKTDVFRMLDQVVKPTSILASNTSSLSVTRIAEATARPELVAGLHFFNPVHRMELVEVVRGAETTNATIAALVAFVRALGKTPIVTADSPGFLVNRVLFPYLGEAILMVGEGEDVTKIDRQVKRFGMPMGPLELLDQVGLDVALHVAGSLEGVLSGLNPVVDQLRTMVQRGHLGKKTSIGFYQYRDGKRGGAAGSTTVDAARAKHDRKTDFAKDSLHPVQRRLIYPMLAEAVRCHEEGVVGAAWAIDLAMVLGTGFAPHRGGPLHVIDALGVDLVTENLERLRDQLGDRFRPPAQLVEMSRSGATFFGGKTGTRSGSETTQTFGAIS